jgi:putative DNA primase/helicase
MTSRPDIEAAPAYAGLGWPIIPCHSPDPSHPTGCSCRRSQCAQPAKHPRTRNGHLDATVDPEQIGHWWRMWPNSNIGCCPGRAGLLVIDIDGPEGEAEAQRLGLLYKPTLTALTARGGHLYFQHPGGTIGNRKLNGILDVRADKGFVLLPPSRHVSGHVYRWAREASEILRLTPEALEALRPAKRSRPRDRYESLNPPRGNSSRYIARAIEEECMALALTPEGARNHQLNVAAFSLGRFAATGEADLAELMDVLRFAAAHAGLEGYEIEKTIRSAFQARGVTT